MHWKVGEQIHDAIGIQIARPQDSGRAVIVENIERKDYICAAAAYHLNLVVGDPRFATACANSGSNSSECVQGPAVLTAQREVEPFSWKQKLPKSASIKRGDN
jgi:hypothetical protein